MPQRARRVTCLAFYPRARAITALNSASFQAKGGEGFAQRESLQNKPKAIHISLRENRALKLHTFQGSLVAAILLRTYDDHAAAGLF